MPLLNLQPKKPDIFRVFLFIMLCLLVLVSIAIMTSCAAKKQNINDSVKTVTKDKIIYKDTTIYVIQKGDNISVKEPCPEAKPFDIIKKHNGIVTELKGNGKTVSCDCKDDSLLIVIAKIRADHYAEIDSTKEETRLLECNRQHRTNYDVFCRWLSLFDLVFILLFMAYLGMKIKK